MQIPGTVSKILWHFTGGPQWDSKNQCQSKERKPDKVAYNNLCSILKSDTLKIGSYHEKIETYINSIHKVPKVNSKIKNIAVISEKPITITTNPVCCLADIPLQYLEYHSNRYGKFAIGFSRDRIKNKFNPVFYTPNTEIISGHLSDAFKKLKTNIENIEALEYYKNEFIQELKETINNQNSSIIEFDKFLDTFRNIIKNSSNLLLEDFSYFASFIKTIDDYNEIYNEREWRSLFDYNIHEGDIQCIILPCEQKMNYYDDFVKNKSKELNISKSISIIPWENISEWVDKIDC